MRKLLPLFVLTLTLAAIGQTAADESSAVQADYDKFKDVTHVRVSDKSNSVAVASSFMFSGQSLKSNVETFYLFFAGSDCRGFCFKNPSLIVLADGKRVFVGEHRTLGDSTIYAIPRSTYATIASATTVEFQVGSFEGTWEAAALAKFKALLAAGTKTPPTR